MEAVKINIISGYYLSQSSVEQNLQSLQNLYVITSTRCTFIRSKSCYRIILYFPYCTSAVVHYFPHISSYIQSWALNSTSASADSSHITECSGLEWRLQFFDKTRTDVLSKTFIHLDQYFRILQNIFGLNKAYMSYMFPTVLNGAYVSEGK